MLRPIEFDASAGPRPGQPNQRGLNHPLKINQVAAVAFVLDGMDAPAHPANQDAERLVLKQTASHFGPTGFSEMRS